MEFDSAGIERIVLRTVCDCCGRVGWLFLRGGRGAVIGVIAGAAVMRCLYKAIVVLQIPQEWEMVIIGAALLISVLVDEVIRRYRDHRRVASV